MSSADDPSPPASLPPLAVTFDFGQTLAELDTGFMVSRLAERGARAEAAALEAALPRAWRTYDAEVQSGRSGHPWKLLVRTLLEGARVEPGAGSREPTIDALVDWLWDQQPVKNLWRRPWPGTIEIVDELRARGVPVGVLSNSEGKLAELIAEMGWSARLPLVADSGKLGMEKPGREIFAWTAEQLGVPIERVVHVGDSRSADVDGALAAGQRAVWFGPHTSGIALPPRAAAAKDARELRAVLVRWGLLPGT